MKTAKHARYGVHLSTYAWAAPYCFEKEVVDIGCGEGFGLQMLSMFATWVSGIDISPTFLNRARKKQYYCPHPPTFRLEDLDKDPTFPEGAVIVAFEVLEHIKDPKKLVRNLHKRGHTLVFSVPHNYPHKLHLTNFTSLAEVQGLVQPYLEEGCVQLLWMTKRGLISKEPPLALEGEDSLARYLGVCSPR